MLETQRSADQSASAARERYLEAGLQVRVSDLTDTLGGYASSVASREGRIIWLTLPIRRDGMLSLSIGQLVSIRFDIPGDAAYLFDSVVTDVRDDDAAPFGVAMPVTINRRPHRADARLALVLDATFEDPDGVEHTGKVVDLSAGGLGLICSSVLPAEAQMSVRCELPGPGEPLTIERRVEVCSTTLYGRTPANVTLYQYGLRFVDADDRVREQILASVIWNLTQNPEVL